MNPLQRWIVFTAVNTAAAAVIKSMLRAKPETHMQMVDYLYEQARHEADRFRRLHAKEEGDDTVRAAADQR